MPIIHKPKKEKPEGCRCRWRPWAWVVPEFTIWQCGKCSKKWITVYWSMGSDGSQVWDEHEAYLERQAQYEANRKANGW